MSIGALRDALRRGPASQPKSVHIACPTLMLGNVELRLAA